MPPRPTFSLLVPTRGRPVQLRRFLDSLAAMASHPGTIEVVLVVDEDDPTSRGVRHDRLLVRHVVVPPGLTMGSLNTAGYEVSAGRYVMLLNDDVVARTRGWDERILEVFRSHPDDIVLVHTNDTLLREHLCVFPVVSRTYCELAGGICPRVYLRYRIDDHIEDVFNLLGVLGERRTVFLPDVIFEHLNAVAQPDGPPVYLSDPKTLALDIPPYEALFPERKELALRLLEHIEAKAREATTAARRRRLASIDDPSSLRVVERLRVESAARPRRSADTRVTVAVVTGDGRGDRCHLCLDAIAAHTENFELVILDSREQGGCYSPGALNRFLHQARTDFVALLCEDVLVGPGWLDGLLACTGADTGVVTPVFQTPAGDVISAGIVFHPDSSGHHRHILAAPRNPSPVFTFGSPVLLLDRARCRNLVFDETYQRYFFGIDFGLRVWEAGLRVVCTPATRMTCLTPGSPPYGDRLDRTLFERDRRTFVAQWMASGRCERLREEVWNKVPELQRLLDREGEAGRLLSTDSKETMESYSEPSPTLRFWQRVRNCYQRRGFLGLVRAVGRRLLAAGGFGTQSVRTSFPRGAWEPGGAHADYSNGCN